MTDPAGRVRTSLPELVAHVAGEYSLGTVRGWSVVATGYEDCNIAILLSPGGTTPRTPRGMSDGNAHILDIHPDPFRMMVKVFAFGRPAAIAKRTAGLIMRARAAGVRHPRLYPDASGRLVHEYDGHQLVVMDFAPGRTFYELGRPPCSDELGAVVEQAVRIHSVDAYPEPVFDPWAIANLVPLANQVHGLLDDDQRRRVDAVISDMSGIDWAALPEALIHADLTAGNVLLGDDGTISVLDFALANRWPRLQEIAVIAASLLHGSPDPIASRMSSVAALYSSLAPSPLTSLEWDALHVFGRAAAAMELLGGLAQWQQGNRGAETDSLVEIGTTGLRDYALRRGVALPAAAADDSGMGVGPGDRFDPDGDQIQFGSARTPRWLLQRHPRVCWLAAGATTASLVWSPDSRWLFTLAANGAIEAVDVRTGRRGGLGVALPPVSYLASGTPG